jgi:pyruvate dehydrogenase E2 component (dihydrolipoamide acetyltransferase)
MAKPITIDSAGGEYMESVVVLEWAASVGDAVRAGDVLVTVETAKAATEIEAPEDGFLTAIFAEAGSEVPLSAILGLIGATAEDADHAAPSEAATVETPQPVAAQPQPSGSDMPPQYHQRQIASPAARRLALQRGIDLRTLRASSPSGRIKLRDLALPTMAVGAERLPDGVPPDDHGPLKVHRSGPSTGIPVVMIHGFGADAQSWYPVERELARRHPVLRIDLPNHGQSPKRRTASFASLARAVVEAFDALHLGAAHLVGHSLGGACALALTDIRPRSARSLTLLAPGGLGPLVNGDFIAGFARASQTESLGPWLRVMVADPRLIGDDFVAAAMTSRRDPLLRAAQVQMGTDLFPDGTQSFDLRAALDRVACPTRLLWGRADAILPWRQALSAPGRVALHLFEGVGHVPHLERTDDVLHILRAQIDEVSE